MVREHELERGHEKWQGMASLVTGKEMLGIWPGVTSVRRVDTTAVSNYANEQVLEKENNYFR